MEVVWSQPGLTEHGVLHGLRFCADDISKELFLINTLLRRLLQQEDVSPPQESWCDLPVSPPRSDPIKDGGVC